MKIIIAIIALLSFFSFNLKAEPRVLKCDKDCGKLDINNNYSFQARLAMGQDMWGANVTFIEKDIILSSGHILGFEPSRKKLASCGSEASKMVNNDWYHNKNDMYVVDGSRYPQKKVIIAKVLDISIRNTGEPPGYDIMLAHVDRNCKKCNKKDDITIVPIPISNKIPQINTKAIHVAVPGSSRINKGRFYDSHLLNGLIWGDNNNICLRQTIKHDGKSNPPMIFDTSGSPVIFKECGQLAVHGLHGNGNDEGGFMFEHLQLLQTQKKWIYAEIKRWTGRNEILDACSPTGLRSFSNDIFDTPQNDCNIKQSYFRKEPSPIRCDIINQDGAFIPKELGVF